MSYDQFAHTFSTSRRDHPWPEIDYIIADIQSRNSGSILDIGCGNGRFIEEWDRHEGWEIAYLGVDSSSGMIDEAEELHPEHHFWVVSMQDITTLHDILKSSNIPPTFDSIILLASYHHLETREERIVLLKNLHSFLNPYGCIYMTNWNLLGQGRYEKSHRWDEDFDIKIGEFSRYYHGFTIDELQVLFDETGWNTVENSIFAGGRNIVSILQKKES
jgi:tRNA (uracil-5-)-methyltransferase TRM9